MVSCAGSAPRPPSCWGSLTTGRRGQPNRSDCRAGRSRWLAAARGNAEERATGVADLAGPAQGGLGLALGGAVAGIASVHGETGQEIQTAPQGAQRSMVWDKQRQEGDEIVRSRHHQAEF